MVRALLSGLVAVWLTGAPQFIVEVLTGITAAQSVTVYVNNNIDGCGDWEQVGTPANCSDFGPAGGGSTYNGGKTNIATDAACYGGSGKCIRHPRADGDDSLGGGVNFQWEYIGIPAGVTQFYMCYWSKHEAGMTWHNGAINQEFGTATNVTPNYTKDIYVNNPAFYPSGPSFTTGFHGANWGLNAVTPAGAATQGAIGWTALYGATNVSDGTWHRYELYVSVGAAGARRSWVDGTQVENTTWNMSGGAGAFFIILIGSNQRWLDNDATPGTNSGPDKYTYYDNIYISSARPTGTAGVCGAI